jgi:hypothetical protein
MNSERFGVDDPIPSNKSNSGTAEPLGDYYSLATGLLDRFLGGL